MLDSNNPLGIIIEAATIVSNTFEMMIREQPYVESIIQGYKRKEPLNLTSNQENIYQLISNGKLIHYLTFALGRKLGNDGTVLLLKCLDDALNCAEQFFHDGKEHILEDAQIEFESGNGPDLLVKLQETGNNEIYERASKIVIDHFTERNEIPENISIESNQKIEF